VSALLTDDHCQLWEAIVALGCHATSFNNAFTASQQQQVQAHEVTINMLLDYIQSTTSIDGSVVPKGGLKFCEPHVFDGKIKVDCPFLDEIESAVWLQCQALITDYDKALYLSGYLKDGGLNPGIIPSRIILLMHHSFVIGLPFWRLSIIIILKTHTVNFLLPRKWICFIRLGLLPHLCHITVNFSWIWTSTTPSK
jgi:hypothetical protein